MAENSFRHLKHDRELFNVEEEDFGNIYSDPARETLLEDDMLSPAEEGFMRGYQEAEEEEPGDH